MPDVTSPSRLARFGNFELDLRVGELRRQGLRIRLPEQPFQILAMLLECPGEVVTREAIRERLWSHDTVVEFEHSINTAVKRLREALGDSAERPRFVETLARRGYRFLAAVEWIHPTSPHGEPTLTVPPVPTPAEMPEESPRTAHPARREKSLAVAYFENLAGEKEDEYFRDGITEDIIIELSKISELWVLSRSSVFAYRDKPTTASQMGQQLGASYVLEGSLRRAGSRLRITAQLVETSTGRSVWAVRYDRQLEDVFAIQDEIAQNIAGALQVVLSDKEKRAIEKVPTSDVKAYEYYLRGRQFFHQFRGKALGFARQMFMRAIETDPNYARAYAGIADCCSFLYMYFESTEANLREAEAASRRALELDPDLAEAHAARGLAVALNRRYDEAAREFETAIRLNPKLFEAYYFYGRAMHGQGNMEAAAEMFQKASEVNPDDYQTPHFLAMALRALGRSEEGRAADLRGLQVVEKHVQMYPDDSRALLFGATQHLQAGNRGKCLEWVARALAITPDEPITFYNAACNYSLAGEVENAIRCLEKAITSGMAQRDWIEHDSDLDPVRQHPRFQALLSRMNLADKCSGEP
jgi:adenylate cyclase